TELAMAARKTRTISDDERKAGVLEHALAHAGQDGFSDAVLRRAAKEAGVNEEMLLHLFPRGPAGLVEYFSQSADAERERRVGAQDLAAMKIRERIAAAVLARLAAVKAHKDAARRAAAFLLLPMHAALGMTLVYRTVDAMWRAAGDTATDFNFYSKRAIL